jgi:hypothetical protein
MLLIYQAGSLRLATLKPDIPASVFPPPKTRPLQTPSFSVTNQRSNSLRYGDIRSAKDHYLDTQDEYSDDELDDEAMNAAGEFNCLGPGFH